MDDFDFLSLLDQCENTSPFQSSSNSSKRHLKIRGLLPCLTSDRELHNSVVSLVKKTESTSSHFCKHNAQRTDRILLTGVSFQSPFFFLGPKGMKLPIYSKFYT